MATTDPTTPEPCGISGRLQRSLANGGGTVQHTLIFRTAMWSACLLLWGLVLYGALCITNLDLPWQHGICGPWGCGPPPQALAACHLFWFSLLFPPALVAIRKFPASLVAKLGWILAGTGAFGIAAIVLYESVTWLPHVSDGQRGYFLHRCLFAVATLIELPVVETLVLGMTLRALAFRRSAIDPRSASLPDRTG